MSEGGGSPTACPAIFVILGAVGPVSAPLSCADFPVLREVDATVRQPGSVETSARGVSVGPGYCRERIQDPVLLPSPALPGRVSHDRGRAPGDVSPRGPPLTSGERGHRACSPPRAGLRLLQPIFCCSQEGRGAASDFGPAGSELYSEDLQVQDAHAQGDRVPDQLRGLVCDDRPQRCLFSHKHSARAQEVPQVRFRGRSVPVLCPSFWPSHFTTHVFEVHGCCPDTVASPVHNVLGLGSDSRGVSPSQDSFDGCLALGLGRDLGWPPCPGPMGGPLSLVAHKLPGDEGCVSSIETLSPTPQRLPCRSADRQHCGGVLYQSSGRSVFTPPVQVGTADSTLGRDQVSFAESGF
ncbi:hypothetical protein Q7C36_000513 [Tachysurus vachellii]|uniref:Uncharacterized protein n=1 Tax=Tachysurus vachellii TaxID=175792 RepID=A0AA88NW63_TACVA|nr:hypothetical protein Q7C36_000513 [Tachysurus vachellii]